MASSSSRISLSCFKCDLFTAKTLIFREELDRIYKVYICNSCKKSLCNKKDNLKFREKKGFIVDIELKDNDIFKILEMLKKEKNLNDISKEYKIDVNRIKKFIKKYLLKKDETNFELIINKYSIKNEEVKIWIEETFKCYKDSENV